MNKQRLSWLDITKGFLMILVVIGHYPGELDFPLSKYIYWFHMPAFFISSGMFFKPAIKKGLLKSTIHKRFMQLIVPYLFFLMAITVIRYGIQIGSGNLDISWYLDDVWITCCRWPFCTWCVWRLLVCDNVILCLFDFLMVYKIL